MKKIFFFCIALISILWSLPLRGVRWIKSENIDKNFVAFDENEPLNIIESALEEEEQNFTYHTRYKYSCIMNEFCRKYCITHTSYTMSQNGALEAIHFTFSDGNHALMLSKSVQGNGGSICAENGKCCIFSNNNELKIFLSELFPAQILTA
jgi:hypothetical protein